MKLPFQLVLIFYLAANVVYAQPSKLGEAEIKVITDSLLNLISKQYVLKDIAHAYCQQIENQRVKGAYSKANTPAALADILTKDLRDVKRDWHLRLFYEPEIATIRSKPSKNEWKEAEKAENFNLRKLEIFSGNIGYFNITSFPPGSKEAKAALHSALTFLKNSAAIIIDLRDNGGGSPGLGIENYFFKERTYYYNLIARTRQDTVKEYTDPDATEGLHLNMPVYILVNKNTASGAEAFCYSMQALKRAVVIGSPTLGAAHLSYPVSLGYGLTVIMPFAQPLSPVTNTNWEGEGVIPNITLPDEKILYKTRKLILQDLLSKSVSEKEKNRILWALDDLEASNVPHIQKQSLLHHYIGTYEGEISFFIKNKKLQCLNEERGGGYTFSMTPITNTRFVLDEYAHVEFLKDSKGKYSSLKWFWKNGDSLEKRRVNKH